MFEEVKEAFNRQSGLFDDYESQNEILRWMRSAARGHILKYLKPGDKVLELNAGTGLDAVFLAEKGFTVHAIDISEGMLKKLSQKINRMKLQDKITFEELSYTELDKLKLKSNMLPFDFIFSNFGGLNCVADLRIVTKHFGQILKPGGKVCLVIMPPVSPWEIALALKGKFKPAFRRLHKGGITANVEGVKFQTYYHSLKKLKHALGKEFKLIEAQGLASISPPPYINNFPKRYPNIYKFLLSADKIFSHIFPFNRCADHYAATFEFKEKI